MVAEQNSGGIADRVFDLAEVILPRYLDYRAGYDPNALPWNQQPVYLHSPAGESEAEKARSASLYGKPGAAVAALASNPLVVVGVVLGALVVAKALKVI